MSSLITTAPLLGNLHSLRQFTVDEYHKMTETGILDDTDRVELLEGYVVLKIPRNPPHDGTIQLLDDVLTQVLPVGWTPRFQSAITLAESEPEPDCVLARGTKRSFLLRHPNESDVGLVTEVADSSLNRDRIDKGRIYARAGIPIYWIINLVDCQAEVYTIPSGPTNTPAYGQRQDYLPGSDVPLVLDGVTLASIAVLELLP
jgi:Uma2 family endonuclease